MPGLTRHPASSSAQAESSGTPAQGRGDEVRYRLSSHSRWLAIGLILTIAAALATEFIWGMFAGVAYTTVIADKGAAFIAGGFALAYALFAILITCKLRNR